MKKIFPKLSDQKIKAGNVLGFYQFTHFFFFKFFLLIFCCWKCFHFTLNRYVQWAGYSNIDQKRKIYRGAVLWWSGCLLVFTKSCNTLIIIYCQLKRKREKIQCWRCIYTNCFWMLSSFSFIKRSGIDLSWNSPILTQIFVTENFMH